MASHKLYTAVAVVVALAVVALFFVFGNPFNSPSATTTASDINSLATQPSTTADTSQTPQSLVAQDETVGTGATAVAGETVYVNYTGRLQDGTVFDTSVGKPPAQGCSVGFCFKLGTGQVIPGWDQGLQGMKVGGKRLLIIPPSLGYGAQAVGPIPANSTLVFEVTLLKVDSPAATQ